MNKWFIKVTKTCVDETSDFYGTVVEDIIGKKSYRAGFKIIKDCGGYGRNFAQWDAKTNRYSFQYRYLSEGYARAALKKMQADMERFAGQWKLNFEIIEL